MNSIAQWCDNKAAVDTLNSPRLTHMLAPDADIMLVIESITERLEWAGTCISRKHVYGHQDTKQRGMERGPGTTQALSIKAKINVECGKLATEMTKALMMPGPTPVLQEINIWGIESDAADRDQLDYIRTGGLHPMGDVGEETKTLLL
jgi:hypothetical protein